MPASRSVRDLPAHPASRSPASDPPRRVNPVVMGFDVRLHGVDAQRAEADVRQ